jgi:glycosyltransferase involved in cell wall biosynthesis
VNRIGLLHYSGPPVIGGVESTIAVHARMLVTSGYKVTVIAGSGSQFEPQVAVRIVPEIGSRHPRVLAIGKELASGNVTHNFERLKDDILASIRPLLDQCDVLIVHNAVTMHKNLALTAALFQLSCEKQSGFIAWCHDFAWLDDLYIPELHPGLPWDLLRRPWPNVKYVVVSQHRRRMIAGLLKIPEEQASVITPGVAVAEFLGLSPLVNQLVAELDLFGADPLILLPARVTRRKNIEFAIQVTACMKALFPLPILIVTGPPGPHNPRNLAYLNSLNQLKDELSLQENVYFLYEQGKTQDHLELPYSAISELYRISDLLLFPSQREGFGIPVLEAGLARIPVFAASIPSIHESMGDFATYFDPQGDPQRVARLIQGSLAKSTAYKLRHQMMNRFSWDSIFHQQMIPLLKEVSA